MESRIQYALTKDGVSIAFWTMGEGGTPFVLDAPLGYSHISHELTVPGLGEWYQQLASTRMIVRFDHRGYGMSERDIEDYSPAAWGRDIEAVVACLSGSRVHLYGCTTTCQAVIVFAADHPERVDRLVLAYPQQGTDHLRNRTRFEGFLSFAKSDWSQFTEVSAHSALGWSPGGKAHDYASFIRQSVDQQDQVRLIEATPKFDVTDYLTRVRAPTLLLADTQGHLASRPTVRRFASSIPRAQLVAVAGEVKGTNELAPHENERVARAIEGFLDESDEVDAASGVSWRGRTASPLTRRELDVLRLLVLGRTNQQIADELVISVNTVLRHVTHIYHKIGAANRAEAAAYASRNGLLHERLT